MSNKKRKLSEISGEEDSGEPSGTPKKKRKLHIEQAEANKEITCDAIKSHEDEKDGSNDVEKKQVNGEGNEISKSNIDGKDDKGGEIGDESWDCYDHLKLSDIDEDDEKHEGKVFESPSFKKKSSVIDVLLEEGPNDKDEIKRKLFDDTTENDEIKTDVRLRRPDF